MSDTSPRRRHGAAPGAPREAAAGRVHRTPRPTHAHPHHHHHHHHESSRVRIPIGIKYGVVSAAILIAAMVFLGSSVYYLAVATADREVNDKGIKTTLLLAASLDPFWADADRADPEKNAAQIEIEYELRSFLQQPGAEGVLDIVIFPEDATKFVVAASGSNRLGLAAGPRLPSAEADRAGVLVRSGVLEGSAFRSYEKALEHEGRDVGLVRVFISAAEIERLRESLKSSATMLTLIALLVSIGIGAFVGSILTRPVRELKDDMAIVARGDLSHQSSVRTGDELEALAHAFNRMTSHLADAQEREASRKALERELAIATKIQNALLPDDVPQVPDFEIAPYYASAREVGGDYYDFIEVGKNRYGLVVADVSGKGIPGSLVMTMTRSLVRMAARESADPARILGRANVSLYADMTRGMFVTCIYGDFDTQRGTVAVARAGHNPAYIYRASRRELELVQPGGMALGIDSGMHFDPALEVREYLLNPGDFLVFYTDGIIEAMDPDGNEYTAERFAAVLAELHSESAARIVDLVIEDVLAHTRGAEPSDDITMLVLRRSARGGGGGGR
ncbi:MAG: PP2C family protein-serine/threonine phosphatase [Planctomycetota bacterium]